MGKLPERISVHLDRGYDSKSTRGKLEDRGFVPALAERGESAPLTATKRWVVDGVHQLVEQRTQNVGLVYRVDRSGRRLPACLLRGDYYRGKAHPERLDPLPMGGPTSPPTITCWRDL